MGFDSTLRNKHPDGTLTKAESRRKGHFDAKLKNTYSHGKLPKTEFRLKGNCDTFAQKALANFTVVQYVPERTSNYSTRKTPPFRLHPVK